MEARLIAIHDSARADQRDFTIADWFCERSEWRRIVINPTVGSEIAVEIARARNVCDRHATHSTIEAKDSANSDEQLRSAVVVDVYVREIFIAREPIAAFGALASNKRNALSQLMSKRQESEECERYRPLESKYFSQMIDAHLVFCDEWSRKVSRGGPHPGSQFGRGRPEAVSGASF
jgi:hypothetical protein